ncbi:MAG: DCC1-like thiol-disulfide oxidoreductase family protein [Planctomycetota bacterium]|nr:DCC1-like thiol-disulfide oxidoreductase family protein [Planctomycetota bacterium]MDA1027012.1 DCC1-like thiol-disulfide oxidoreductase family protein [Planctomycetota bacterium]
MPDSPSIPEGATAVVFYDGECGLCERCVDWCLTRDRHRHLRFAPLQGTTFASIDAPMKPTDLSTMVVWDSGGLHEESDATLALLKGVGGHWRRLASIGRMVPRSLRNIVYRFIAKRRYGWFGTADACRLPSEDDKARFLP